MNHFIRTFVLLSACIFFASAAKSQKLNQVLQEDEQSLKSYFQNNKVDPIEGIYKNVNGSYYRLGVKKMGDLYYAIIIDSHDKIKWKPGTVKATFEATAVEGVFSMRWLMGDRSVKEAMAQLEDDTIIKFKLPTGEFGEMVQSSFIKLFPKSNYYN